MDLAASSTAAVLNIAILVFREGLECVLVLAAITAGASTAMQAARRPIAAGVGAGFIATLATWFVAVRAINNLSNSVPALELQAITGLLAILVLLVVMNWFFHKLYWTGWISFHNRRRNHLVTKSAQGEHTARRVFWGFVALGFTSLYREGFEVVLFLQGYRLQLGGHVVLKGAVVGVVLASAVAALTFVAHRRLPYKKMLVGTGVLLGVVLLVMVGEQAQEMQLAHWLPTTNLPALAPLLPQWMGTWFSLFPTLETLLAQALAALLVLGSYWIATRPPRRASQAQSWPQKQPVITPKSSVGPATTAPPQQL